MGDEKECHEGLKGDSVEYDSHKCGLPCSLETNFCSFPHVFDAEGSQEAHLEPRNGANDVRVKVRFRGERVLCRSWEVFSGPEPLEKEVTLHNPIHRVYPLLTATTQEQGKLRHQRKKSVSRYPDFMPLIPGCLRMRTCVLCPGLCSGLH